MNQFQSFLSKMQKESKGGEQSKSSSQRQGEEQQEQSEDATMKAADKLWEEFTGSPLTKDEKKTAGPIVYYIFGSTMGAVYGAVVEHATWAKAGAGIPLARSCLWEQTKLQCQHSACRSLPRSIPYLPMPRPWPRMPSTESQLKL